VCVCVCLCLCVCVCVCVCVCEPQPPSLAPLPPPHTPGTTQTCYPILLQFRMQILPREVHQLESLRFLGISQYTNKQRNWLIWICTEESEFLDLGDFGDVAFPVETVIWGIHPRHTNTHLRARAFSVSAPPHTHTWNDPNMRSHIIRNPPKFLCTRLACHVLEWVVVEWVMRVSRITRKNGSRH